MLGWEQKVGRQTFLLIAHHPAIPFRAVLFPVCDIYTISWFPILYFSALPHILNLSVLTHLPVLAVISPSSHSISSLVVPQHSASKEVTSSLIRLIRISVSKLASPKRWAKGVVHIHQILHQYTDCFKLLLSWKPVYLPMVSDPLEYLGSFSCISGLGFVGYQNIKIQSYFYKDENRLGTVVRLSNQSNTPILRCMLVSLTS